uniref:FA complementation group F n=1 Tax=Neogobius melanostomus TaxID=47308 RepID=A0A8C6UNA7_9GOBI
MEAMVKNLSSTAELLAVAAHSDTVAQWDQETLHRAFHWALYCEHVYNRFHSNPYSALCFSDLPRCQHLLLHGLLHNVHAPISIMKILYDRPTDLHKNQDRYQDVKGLAELLLNKLDAVLKQTDGAHCANQFLDCVLQGCDEAREDLCVIVAAALQTELTPQLNFILDWLALKPDLLEHMCHSLSSSLLTDIAKRHLRFRDVYSDVLKKWAKEMEYDINNSEWIQVGRNPAVSFQKLTEQFVSLFKGSVSLRDHVETELKALKSDAGDFDVRGLSVWGDLLSEIHKKCPCHS